MTDKTTTDLIVHTLEQKPIDFQQTFDDLLRDRLQDTIQAKKMELAKNIFNNSSYEEEDVDDEDEDVVDHEEQESDTEDEANA